MTLTATSSGTQFTLAPPGTHVARCVQVIDLGHQWSEFYKKSAHKILLGWEMPDELDSEGKPMMVWRRYTLSLNEKSVLRSHLEAWRGRQFTKVELEGFDMKNILDKCCLVSIVHAQRDGNTYSDISAVMALPKGTKPAARISDLVVFDIDSFDHSVFDTFSDNLKKTINQSAEVQKRNEPQEAAIDAHPINDELAQQFEDECPF